MRWVCELAGRKAGWWGKGEEDQVARWEASSRGLRALVGELQRCLQAPGAGIGAVGARGGSSELVVAGASRTELGRC